MILTFFSLTETPTTQLDISQDLCILLNNCPPSVMWWKCWKSFHHWFLLMTRCSILRLKEIILRLTIYISRFTIMNNWILIRRHTVFLIHSKETSRAPPPHVQNTDICSQHHSWGPNEKNGQVLGRPEVKHQPSVSLPVYCSVNNGWNYYNDRYDGQAGDQGDQKVHPRNKRSKPNWKW